jgi:hypothetical protein
MSLNKRKKLITAIGLWLVSDDNEKSKRIWVREIFQNREKQGYYENLLRELQLTDEENYRSFLRMNTETFNNILQLITPLIEKQNTVMRNSISPGERLAVTLRYLATGSYK